MWEFLSTYGPQPSSEIPSQIIWYIILYKEFLSSKSAWAFNLNIALPMFNAFLPRAIRLHVPSDLNPTKDMW